jgi:LPPG:FO 2-phospho-L-lactate transferase
MAQGGGAVVVLAGGVGAARFLRGLTQVIPPEDLLVIGNTGDDLWWHGLYVSPDLDTVTYWLAGIGDQARGWGIQGDTFSAHGALRRLGMSDWFQVGDQDLASHRYRTERLRDGIPLHRVTAELAERFLLKSRILPMSDEPVATRLATDAGDLHFQEYFVWEGCRPAVHEVWWTGREAARPAPGIAEALHDAAAVIIAPSNPVISIGPILRVPGMRALVSAVRSKVVAITPLIAGRAIKGPTVALMQAMGLEPTALGVARGYRDLAAGFVLDEADAPLAGPIHELGYRVSLLPTLLDDLGAATRVAEAALGLSREPVRA